MIFVTSKAPQCGDVVRGTISPVEGGLSEFDVSDECRQELGVVCQLSLDSLDELLVERVEG